jgi:putative transposase
MPIEPKFYYERHLPHWQPSGKTLFITWRLAGSLPSHFWRECPEKSHGRRFLALDHFLDTGRIGPTWLRNPKIANAVADALTFGESHLHLYRVLAFVVMSKRKYDLSEKGRTDIPVCPP